jgi:hypothetical protein
MSELLPVWMHLDLLDTQQRVVLCDSFAPGGRTGLDLSDAESDGQVSDDGVLCFTTSVGDHDAPAVGLCELSTRGQTY